MPVLISKELFDRAQKRFAENKRKGGQRAHGLDEYADSKYLEGLEASKKENEKALTNLLKAIEAGVFTETTQARMLELEERRKSLTEAIGAEKMKQNLMQDEHSIKAYFSKFLHADFQNPEVRDMIMGISFLTQVSTKLTTEKE